MRGCGHVRSGSVADISYANANVRFVPFSGRTSRECVTSALCHKQTLAAATIPSDLSNVGTRPRCRLVGSPPHQQGQRDLG